MYIQFKRIDEEIWILRIKRFYNKIDKLIDFAKILEAYKFHLMSLKSRYLPTLENYKNDKVKLIIKFLNL